MPRARRRAAFGRYLLASAAGNLLWESLQLPLYALKPGAGPGFRAAIVALGEVGDVTIAAAALAAALLTVGDPRWPARGRMRVAAATFGFGLIYTLGSEYVHVMVLRTWQYAPAMPRLPWLGIGVSPVLQWVVVPILALAWTGGGEAGLRRRPSTARRLRAISAGRRAAFRRPAWRRRK